ncbi:MULTISPECIES: hypothetical protein [unclassified Mesorhizobium]|uniref:hypothetical protein n=2 Tax=Mesorhizobium TaxID=68287 RepID=UPI000FCACBC2|nr:MULTISPECIES: hypothetical protein [unclassified Mesorhizobium]MDG4900359.1 hypothetical protein [Mesorhizobium sp. WSM4962]MDG4908917.1 hypothetical protein [Mesorhizobium sp. WSM4898]MDG4917406.1 hypothetical protein [Mesorhizobium sp. WSM4989]RUV44783.1 hypothetical protein EOD29_08500 [Mesorhizobium sp. M1A.T.Ca.IN.004.03.1.1]RWI99297.1 MAG: hypothetical protein EOR21_00880 [Mesorhizobium sp.]
MAQASSIVVLGAATSTPSIVRLAAIEPGKATPSVVALGEPVPAVTDEKVAAIPEKSGQRHAQAPTIIRGGIVGGASATPAATAPAKEAATPANGTAPAATPPNGTAAATPPNGTAQAATNGDTKASENNPATTATASGGETQPEAQPEAAPTPPRFSKAM